MFKKILVPVDLAHAEKSGALIDEAKRLADQDNSELTLLNVVPDIPAYVAAQIPSGVHQTVISDCQTQLDQLAEAHHLPKSTHTKVEYGHPANVIVKAAGDLDSDLIIIASHQPGLSDYLLGSVASRVVRHARCPVLVLR